MESPAGQDPAPSLEFALQRHQIQLPADVCQQLQRWCQLVWDANQRINLTRHTDWDTFVARDLVDVLKLSELLPPDQEVLDIGSGGGVPGMVLAIVRPDLKISLSESVGKKADVLDSLVRQLKLSTVVFHDRAERVLEDLGFDCCTARAVGPLWKLFTWLEGHWPSVRKLYAFKGPRWRDELGEAKQRGLTRGLWVKTVARYPLHSTDPEAPPLESFILRIMPAQK